MRVIVFLFCVMLGGPVFAEQTQSFSSWLDDFRHEALEKGISQDVLADAFSGIEEPSDDIIEHDQTQPEKTKSFLEYLSGFRTEKKIAAAQEHWQAHKALFARLKKTYGVPVPILLALWGVESNFGERQGSYSIIESLTTLAYDGRRSQFFRKELLDALTILQQEHKPAEELTGSWAGAMGQIQFMPSSFLAFAVDFDGDGKKDIWNSDDDALASMANYLHQKGWDAGSGWGVEVQLPDSDNEDWDAIRDAKSLREWRKLGVRAMDGKSLPATVQTARLVLPDNDPEVAYLVFSNYDAIMDWNHSTYFATSVGLLADAIGNQ